MKWSEAKAIAEKNIAAMSELIDRAPRGTVITLADYDGMKTFRELKPHETYDLDEHRMILRAAVRLFERKGLKPEIRIIRSGEYNAWLQERNLENTAANRAAFVGLKH